jgi:cell division protein FtsN
MGRDFKSSRSRRGSGFSGWSGVAIGLAIGLAIALVVYVKDHRTPAADVKTAKVGKKKARDAELPGPSGDDEAAGDETPKSYDFYNMLPKFEVVVPEKEKDVKPDLRTAPETRRGTYVLQAGSYKTFGDADRVRAQLAMQGIESKVQKVSVDTDTWHRIRIGPIKSLDELNRMRQKLRQADIEVLVIRVGD